MVCQSQRWCVTKRHTASPVPQVPRLPRKTKVDVTKCHACHTKQRWMSPSNMRPATQSTAASPATKRAQAWTNATPEPARCHKCHACHAKRRWMSPSATPAMRSEGGCHQVPRLPRKVPRRHRRPSAPKRAQARHQSQSSAIPR